MAPTPCRWGPRFGDPGVRGADVTGVRPEGLRQRVPRWPPTRAAWAGPAPGAGLGPRAAPALPAQPPALGGGANPTPPAPQTRSRMPGTRAQGG